MGGNILTQVPTAVLEPEKVGSPLGGQTANMVRGVVCDTTPGEHVKRYMRYADTCMKRNVLHAVAGVLGNGRKPLRKGG